MLPTGEDCARRGLRRRQQVVVGTAAAGGERERRREEAGQGRAHVYLPNRTELGRRSSALTRR